mmetsp:Transcript_22198/g.56682  ORF Transcript_22198/g.56682 Transcript_22198/m.56682 type:complete len:250 (-) Transcript_22198:273-1022(-)
MAPIISRAAQLALLLIPMAVALTPSAMAPHRPAVTAASAPSSRLSMSVARDRWTMMPVPSKNSPGRSGRSSPKPKIGNPGGGGVGNPGTGPGGGGGEEGMQQDGGGFRRGGDHQGADRRGRGHRHGGEGGPGPGGLVASLAPQRRDTHVRVRDRVDRQGVPAAHQEEGLPDHADHAHGGRCDRHHCLETAGRADVPWPADVRPHGLDRAGRQFQRQQRAGSGSVKLLREASRWRLELKLTGRSPGGRGA